MVEKPGAPVQDKLFIAGVEHTARSTVVTYARSGEDLGGRVEVLHDYPLRGFVAARLRDSGLHTQLAVALNALPVADPTEQQKLQKTIGRLNTIEEKPQYFVDRAVLGQEDY